MILIACPLKKELQFLKRALESQSFLFESKPAKKMTVHNSSDGKFLLAEGGHGKVQFGLQTQYLLNHVPGIQAVFCVGAAGALHLGVQPLDLVVGEQTLEHDYKQKFNPNAPMPAFQGCSQFLSQAKALPPFSKFRVHVGKIASGDEDIVHSHRAEELFKETEALAVAWEGVGGARAAAFHGVPFLEIRAVTDNARDSVPESFSRNLEPSMMNAAMLIRALIS